MAVILGRRPIFVKECAILVCPSPYLDSTLTHLGTSGWNNITFGLQGDIGIIHSFSEFDLGMTPCDLGLGGGASAGRPFSFELKTLGER